MSTASVRYAQPPLSPIVEATLSLTQDAVRQCQSASRPLTQADIHGVESRILASGHRFAWSAQISRRERPDAYEGGDDADGASKFAGFKHPSAPRGEPDADGRALRGVGDNVVRHERDVVGVARYIRTSAEVLHLLTNGVASHTIAVIDDSGGTLTAPIIEKFAGVICAGGTVRSHLGILTREYNIPCVMNAKVAGIEDGDRVCIEVTAMARTTEDYQQNIERTARIWLLPRET